MSKSIFDCPHDSISSSGECEECGLCISGTSNATSVDLTSGGEGYSTYVPVKQPSFLTEISMLDIPDEVRSEAVLLSESSSREIHRMGVRKQLLFIYIYLAYLRLKIAINPVELAIKIRIDPPDLSEAIRIISGTSSTGISSPSISGHTFTAPVVIISPIQFIKQLCEKYHIEQTSKIVKFAKSVLSRDTSNILLGKNPCHVAPVLIRTYLDRHGIKYSKNFCKEVSANIFKKVQLDINRIIEN